MPTPWELMWEALPPGFRFHPTDEEFVNHYLTNYILGVNDDFDVIPIVDDLFKRDPSELPSLFKGSSIIRSKDQEWWFLTTLRYKSPKDDKFDRSTSKGSWKITGQPKVIHNHGVHGQIAEMRNVVFFENPRKGKTNWVIHEYYLREQRKYVLCHLVYRQCDDTEMSMNMEVDLEFEEGQCGFPEEIIQAHMRSLMGGAPSPATNAPIHNPQERHETLFYLTEGSSVGNFDEMEHGMSTSCGDKEDNIEDLLNCVLFSTDEESTHSDEFEDMSFYKQLFEPEETSRAASNHVVLKENRRARPPGTLEGYVDIDETRGFVEEDFQREEAGEASSLPDPPKTLPPPPKYPMASPVIKRRQSTPPGRTLSLKEGKAKGAQIAGTEPRSLTLEVSRNHRPQTLRPSGGNMKMSITSREKNPACDGCRPPFDYLVNLEAGLVLLVLMILWLLSY